MQNKYVFLLCSEEFLHKNGSWEYILNGKKRYTWNEHVGTQNSVIGGDSTQGHIAFGKICFFLATGTSPM